MIHRVMSEIETLRKQVLLYRAVLNSILNKLAILSDDVRLIMSEFNRQLEELGKSLPPLEEETKRSPNPTAD